MMDGYSRRRKATPAECATMTATARKFSALLARIMEALAERQNGANGR